MAIALSTKFLAGVIERGAPPTNFLATVFGGTPQTTDAETIKFDQISSAHKVAPYVSRGAEASTVQLQGFETLSYAPPVIKLESPISEKDLGVKSPGTTEYDVDSLDRAGEIVLRALKNKEEMIQRAEELQFADLFTTGTVKVRNQNGTVVNTINYSRSTALSKTLSGADRWNQSGADPVTQLEAYANTMRKNNGRTPIRLILGQDAAAAFRNNAAVKSSADIMRGQIDAAFARQWNEQFQAALIFENCAGMQVWAYSGGYRNEAGVYVPYVPSNGAILASPGEFEMHYAGVTEIYQGTDGQRTRMVAAKRLVDIRVNENVPNMVARIQSAPLAVALNPNSSMFINVLGT